MERAKDEHMLGQEVGKGVAAVDRAAATDIEAGLGAAEVSNQVVESVMVAADTVVDTCFAEAAAAGLAIVVVVVVLVADPATEAVDMEVVERRQVSVGLRDLVDMVDIVVAAVHMLAVQIQDEEVLKANQPEVGDHKVNYPAGQE